MPNIIRFGYSGTTDIDVGPSYFGDGSDGVGLFTSNTTWEAETQDTGMIVKNFESLTIAEGVTVSAGNRNCGMIVYVNGDCTINGTLANKMSPKTILDSDGVDFSIYPPSMLTGVAGNGGKGGSSATDGNGVSYAVGGDGMTGRFYGGGWSGGGASGGYNWTYNSTGVGASGGSVANVTTAIDDSLIFKGGTRRSSVNKGEAGSYGGGASGGMNGGSAVGSSGAGGSSPGANGGSYSVSGTAGLFGGGGGAGNYGGGVIILFVAGTLTINGSIDCSGGRGGNGGTTYVGKSGGSRFSYSAGGGGAGGGRIYIVHQASYELTGTLNVSGGAAGYAGGANYRDEDDPDASLRTTGSVAAVAGTAGDTQVYTLAQYKSKELGINDGIELLNMTIIGGTEQPEDPAENTVWVNTETEIAGVYLSPNAPESPAAGDVWINTTNKYKSDGTNGSTNIMCISDSPCLEINVLNISQYDGSAWVRCDNSAIYANGAWTTMACWIYNYGTLGEFTLKAGGLASNYLDGNVDNYPVSLGYYGSYFRIPSGYYDEAARRILAMTTTTIPAEKYNTIRVTLKKSNANNYSNIGYCLISNPSTSSKNYGFYALAQIPNNNTQQTVEVDISTLTGNIYPTIQSSGEYALDVYLWCFTA